MNPRVIQLFSNVAPPVWWQRLLEKNPFSAQFVCRHELLSEAVVVLLPRLELTRIRKEELSPSKSYVLVDEAWSSLNLRRSFNLVRGALFCDVVDDPSELVKVIQVALARLEEREHHGQLMQMMRTQNRRIEELNQSLEQSVRERTNNEAESRRASQKNIARMRELIGFIKEMTQVLDVADLLPLIRRHVKEYHGLESPLLFVPRGPAFGDLYYMRSSQTVRTRVRGEWEISSRLRIGEPRDSQFLANAMGRPVAKILRFPLVTVRHQRDPGRSPLLLFEHDLPPGALEPLVTSLSEKLQPVSWALDRLVLEQELKSTSREWEMTFDELSEPIAILDLNGKILRANSHWRPEFSGVLQIDTPTWRSGQQLYSIEKYPIRLDAESAPLSWVVYLRDETRSQKLKSQVVQVEKMSAIGQLAGHIAHELNNPLTGIRSLSQVLLREVPKEQPLHQDLLEVENAAARSQGIINNLLDFSRGGIEQRVERLDLNDITKRTLPFLKSATGRFRSDVQLTENPLMVRVEPQLIQQVIFNLVNNACQAMTDRGEIVVQTQRHDDWAILEVRDTGPGISAAIRDRIFEPFFTTKPEGEGTGLGLSLSRDFVRQFGGDLECESEEGSGSVFRVRLPLDVGP